MAVQQVRRSQFITTYGPGAILEGQFGPRVILMPERGLFSHLGLEPSQLEIQDRRLGAVLNAKVYRLPSSAELQRTERPVYRTSPFPSWQRCIAHDTLYRGTCPFCGEKPRDRSDTWRFIMACTRGHMDDVDWVGAVHAGRSRCDASYLKIEGGGGTLSETQLICPTCDARRTLGDIYYDGQLRCSGRYPESERAGKPDRPGCDAEVKVIHRGALNLRIPEVRSVMLLPPLETDLHRLLLRGPIQGYISGVAGQGRLPSAEQLREAVRSMAQRDVVSQTLARQIEVVDNSTLDRAIRDIMEYRPPSTMAGLLEEELQVLQEAARVGHPPEPRAGLQYRFEVVKTSVREIPAPMSGRRLRIVPISRLRVLTVQTGYRRLSPVGSDFVSVAHEEADGTRWLVGVELDGEGIFIESVEPLDLSGRSAREWSALHCSTDVYPEHLFVDPDDPYELDPRFVWWHTLSHRLISAVGIDSGFSSTSIRERVYLSRGPDRRGAVLLYTAQAGGDGTHGGLIGLVPEFERILHLALDDVAVCSNDPLCGDSHVHPGAYTGSACYACLLASETSCEHRNMWLDRHVLLENMP